MAYAVAPAGSRMPAAPRARPGPPAGGAPECVRLYCARHRVTLVAVLSPGAREARELTAPEAWGLAECVLARNLPLRVLQDLAAAPGQGEAIRSRPAGGRRGGEGGTALPGAGAG